MNLIQAIWYLKDNGAVVRPASTFSNKKRMYFFESIEESVTPMLLSAKAIIDMAAVLSEADTFEGIFNEDTV